MAKYGGTVSDFKYPNIVEQAGLPVIAIPTTAGTGSEVTKFTIITRTSLSSQSKNQDEKMLCLGPGLVPKAAIIDYSYTMSLPKRFTADTGIDALTHAIESYVSRVANSFSKCQSLAAIKLLGPNLYEVYKNGDNEKAREDMMLGATLAGIAFSNASVALVHGMSRPLGAFFHVPHGLSNAMLLPAVTAFSVPYAQADYAQCANAMNITTSQMSDNQACEALIKALYRLNKQLQVPSLKQFGITKSEYFEVCELMAQQAIASGSPGNNPVVPSVQQIIDLYHQIWCD